MIRNSSELAVALKCAFNDSDLLEMALTHRSAGAKNGERLEFLGDAILGSFVAQKLYAQCCDASEGEMSRLRASLVRKETLAELAMHWRFGDYIKLGPGELRSGGFRRESILADTLEAVIGAVFLDQGMDAANSLIERLYGSRLDNLSEAVAQKDPKSELQEYLQASGGEPPSYTVTAESGPPHAREFEVLCQVSSPSVEVSATGRSRRAAEQAAAALVLKGFKHVE